MPTSATTGQTTLEVGAIGHLRIAVANVSTLAQGGGNLLNDCEVSTSDTDGRPTTAILAEALNRAAPSIACP